MSYFRHREHSDPVTYSYVDVDDTVNGTSQEGPWETNSSVREMDDVVTPGYSKRIQRGEVVNNPCVMVVNEKSSTLDGIQMAQNVGNPSWKITRTGPIVERAIHYLGYPEGYKLYSNPDLVSQAKLQALSNMDSTPYAFAEDVAEVRETLQFLKRPWASIYDLIITMGKKKSRLVEKGIDSTKALADVWLTYRFAAMPLIQSASDFYESMTEKPKASPPSRRTARGFAQNEVRDQTAYDRVYPLWTYHHITDSKLSDNVHASILYEVSNPIQDWRSRYGFRNKDIPETIWNVIPLSFMVDRVFNISRGIKGLTNLLDPNLQILAASVRTKSEEVYDFKLSGVTQRDAWPITNFHSNTYQERSFKYQRSVWHPTVTDLIPPLNWKGLVDDATSMADLGSLIIQRLF